MITLSKSFIGVDISKESLDIYIYPNNISLKIKNTAQDIKKFILKLSKYDVQQIGCEASGGYEKLFKKLLKKASYKVRLEDPRKIKSFIASQGIKYKNDKIDAQKIAEFLFKNNENYIAFEKTEDEQVLQDLVNRKNDLTKMNASEKARLQGPSHEASIASIKKVINLLEKEISKIDKKIKNIIQNNNELNNKSKILKSVPGIGDVAIATLLSFVPELGKLNSKKISALLGLSPYDNESGKYKGKRFIKGGRSIPRQVLYMNAVTSIRCNSILKDFFDKLISKGKAFKIAIVAVMHKLIIILNSLIKKGEMWKHA